MPPHSPLPTLPAPRLAPRARLSHRVAVFCGGVGRGRQRGLHAHLAGVDDHNLVVLVAIHLGLLAAVGLRGKGWVRVWRGVGKVRGGEGRFKVMTGLAIAVMHRRGVGITEFGN